MKRAGETRLAVFQCGERGWNMGKLRLKSIFTFTFASDNFTAIPAVAPENFRGGKI
jgi:hypothetical protein